MLIGRKLFAGKISSGKYLKRKPHKINLHWIKLYVMNLKISISGINK